MGCKGSQVRILSPRPESKTKPAFYAGFDFGSSGYNEFGVAYVNVCPGSTTSRFDRSVNAGQIVTVAPQPAQKKAPCEGILSPRPESKTKPAFYAGFDFGSSGYNEFGVAYVNVCPWGRSVDCNVSQSGPIFVAVSQIGARNRMHMDRILFWSGQVRM